MTPDSSFFLGQHRLPLGSKTYVMGIVNVTPDSFSDGGRFFSVEAAILHGTRLIEEGADVLDVGGESTRPGATAIAPDEELRRVLPVIKGLKAACPNVPISIDTMKASVAEEALKAGASMVNDVSGFRYDAEMPKRVAQMGASACLMHMRGTPQTMQKDPEYQEVVKDVVFSLRESVEMALQAGIPKEKLMVDPGIGFGKRLEHNLELLAHLDYFKALDLPVLLGTSRKSLIAQLLNHPPPQERLFGSLGSIAHAAALGMAQMVRVHDVKATVEMLTVIDAIRSVRQRTK